MTKEQQATKKNIDHITSDELEIDSHLLKVSRNTGRRALHKLEARGIIDIRPYFHHEPANE